MLLCCQSTFCILYSVLGEKTYDYLGVKETVISTSVCGIVFALLAGQPLMLIGATGPVLVFEQSLYMVSTSIQVQSLTLNSPFILCFLQFSK